MVIDRRQFVHSVAAGVPACAAPTLLFAGARGYSHDEVAARLQRDGSLKGLSTRELSTPCLLLDLDRFEANVAKMARHGRERQIALRPHAKTHKCVEIAKRQVQAGALGVCVATIAEAEVMVRGGVKGVLLTGAMVGRPKITRFLALAKQSPDVMVTADHPDNVKDLQQAAEAARLRLNVLVDLDVGSHRTGIEPGEAALRLAEAIRKSPNLVFKGMSAYAGHAAHVVGFDARKATSTEAMTKALETRDLLERNGHALEMLSGGSTGTYNIDAEIDGVTELQVGSYVFMDVDYRRIGGESGAVYEDFAPSLTVMTTVVHRSADRIIVDGGFKAFATDRRFGPEPKDLAGATYAFMGDEHGRVELKSADRDLKLGDRLEFIIPHCDPNVNLYDRIYGVRGDTVETVWSVMDRAAGLPNF